MKFNFNALKHKLNQSLLVFLALCIASTSVSLTAFADDTSTTKPTTTTQATTDTTQGTTNPESPDDQITIEQAEQILADQRQDLADKIAATQQRLDALQETAKDTEEYINALDEKIGYINEELTVLDRQVATAQAKVDALQAEIEPLVIEIAQLEIECSQTKAELEKLNEQFKSTYDAYCLRLRAMYISGETSIIAILFSSGGISQLLSRLEMIKAITKSDAQLLEQVNAQMDIIITKQDGLNNQKDTLYAKTTTLLEKQNALKAEQDNIVAKQTEIADKKVSLALDRAESDSLLAQYTEKTQMYTEFRNEDEALLESINQELDDLINGLLDPSEVTTAVSGSTSSDNSQTSTTKPIIDDSNKNTLYSKSNAVLNMTYPVPGYYQVSQGYGYYSSGKPHRAVDYPLKTGAKVVAAQKGIVIKTEKLNYSYGYYVMIYHGTDAQGRKVVTLYAHNSEILVSPGQSVAKGQQIAKGGSTGNSTGPHCHFELRLGNEQVNPTNYLSK